MEKPLERVVFSCVWYNTSMVGETISENTSASGSSKWDILKDYDAKQQRILSSQVDYLSGKRNARGSIVDRKQKFEKEGIEKQPTLIRKLGRAVMLATFGLPKREEERMYREAMPVALEELNKKQEEENNKILKIQQEALEKEEAKAKIVKGVEEENQRKLEEARQKLREERERRERDEREKREREEKEKEENALSMMTTSRYQNWRESAKNRYEKQRIQEIIEQDLEKQLIKIEDLEEEALFEESGVKKRMEKYGDKPIEVYDLNGYPFAFLQSDICYKLSGNDMDLLRAGKDPETTHRGIESAARLYRDPSVWNKNEEDISGPTVDVKSELSNAIKTSFRRSSDKSIEQRYYRGADSICYGFESVSGGQLIGIHAQDGGTPAGYEKDALGLESVDAVERAIENTPAGKYNEFVIKRYNENGAARRPDYIIAENGLITNDMKRHADYWGIPIININMKYYPERMKYYQDGNSKDDR